MDILKSTIIQTVFENFYDILLSVTSVTLADSSTVTIQTYTSSFPDKEVDTKSVYPIMVINSPNINWSDFTLTKKWVNGTISIDIFTTKAEAADKLMDSIIDNIETNRDDLKALGLMYINLESTSGDEFIRSKMKIHLKSCRFSFKYIFTKTQV